MARIGVLRTIEGGHIAFDCPGCKMPHVVRISGPGAWGFNGDHERPTFTPSVFVNAPGPYHAPHLPSCHSFVRDGQIQFLGDCTHTLAGQTVPLVAADD